MRIKSQHYHNKKNCKLIPQKRLISTHKDKRTGKENEHFHHFFKCTKHDKDVCRCGWEYGHHYEN